MYGIYGYGIKGKLQLAYQKVDKGNASQSQRGLLCLQEGLGRQVFQFKLPKVKEIYIYNPNKFLQEIHVLCRPHQTSFNSLLTNIVDKLSPRTVFSQS